MTSSNELAANDSIVISTRALLIDFDGTIIDSTAAVIKHWHKVGEELGVDPNIILASSHGRRTIDVIRLYDPARANWDYVCEVEGRIPRQFGQDAVEIPGARGFLSRLDTIDAPWAIVTSGTRKLVAGWLDVLKLAEPKNMVVAEDVENGKPDPACYALGRERLDLGDTTDIVVLEDAPSGIRAGKAAGFTVVGLTTTHTIDKVREAGADYIIQDLNNLKVIKFSDNKITLELKDPTLCLN